MLEDSPLIAHDLTEVRKTALHRLSSEFGEEQQHVQEGMEVFLRARSDVSQHLYDDVVECLEWLQALGVKIGILSNGSAELKGCPVQKKAGKEEKKFYKLSAHAQSKTQFRISFK